MESNDIKLVAVIGAGLSGISVLRRLSENKKFQLTCFEKNFKIGGTWIYTDQTSVNGFETPITTGMYTNLSNCTRPRIPDIPGENEFDGIVIHSMKYRHPELFAGQTVALLGANYSGMDIALQLSNHAKKIYLCHGKPVMDTRLPGNIVEKASTFNRIKQTSVILENGEELEVDSIIYCTGYQYYFPFLPDGIIQTTDDNKMVTSLYKEIVPVDYSSLMFMAVPRLIAFFRHCDHQALFIRAILDGSVVLPVKEEMRTILDQDVQYRPVNADTQWAWHDELSSIAGNFDPNPPVLKQIWDHHFAAWAKDIVKCRKLAYKITGPDYFIFA